MKIFKKGFTLIELIVVIAMIGIVVCIVLATVSKAHAADGCGKWFQPTCSTPSETEKVIKTISVPQLTSSSERANVAERAKRFDDPKKISYVYLVSYGKVMAFYTAKGKVSSLNSYLTPEEEVYCTGYAESKNCTTLGAADIDGTYGHNIEGIFFFTTEGAYVEWRGDYMMSDQPLKLSTQPELIREIK